MEDRTFCLMVDCSRNAVLNLSTLKKLVGILSKCGYNALMLYTEDTYEIEDEPYFGHLRGRYTKKEIKELVDYATNFGIEVIPCIQVLAHLNQMFKWPAFLNVHDFDDVILVEEEKSYELIEKMIKNIKECFKSSRIHLGMDEAAALGLGKKLRKEGKDKTELFLNHLNRVLDICRKYDLSPMMWSDMLFKLASKEEEWYSTDIDISNIDLKAVPKDIVPVYWDYYHDDINFYKEMIDKHFIINKNTWFAGGIWTWAGFAPFNKLALKVSEPAMKACREKGIKNVIITAWGDDGGECSIFSVLPSLFAAKKIYDGEDNFEVIKNEFKEVFNLEFDDFMALDEINDTTKSKGVNLRNPSKYLLYNDPLLGMLDTKVCYEDDKYFALIAKRYDELSNRLGEFGYIAKHLSKLANVLEIKNSLGPRLREAYKNKDSEALRSLSEQMVILITRIDEFIASFRESWYIERKTFGFDVQQIRLGGLKERILEAKNRVDEYLSKKIDIIEEFEQPVLPFDSNDNDDEPGCFNQYIVFASPNRI